MTNDDIIETLELCAKLMELHGENPFKIRALSNAAFRLSKLRYDLISKSQEELENLEGVGKGIAAKIKELKETGTLSELEELKRITPHGVIDMMQVKGLGPKKVAALWHDLHIESVGELLYACNENRLITLKGFGAKTQESVKQSIEFMLTNTNKLHYASLEGPVNKLIEYIQSNQEGIQISLVGELRRKCEVIEHIDVLLDHELITDISTHIAGIPLPVKFHVCSPDEFPYHLFRLTANKSHLQLCDFESLQNKKFNSEKEIYAALELQYIEPELREGLQEVELARHHKIPQLIEPTHLRGTLHNHTTWSDGVHTLKEMADKCISLGLEYFGVCDHSKTAVYANGLSAERVMAQQKEIDELNAGYKGFRILKGIESDILTDGSLDYPEEILKTFDLVVASIHSAFKMDKEHATARLIKAIENPYTSILGHPTGRLLLARPGYPIDHKKVIDACAANKVHIELNAHPYRLDIDWRYIHYCMEKNVMISINPDAHHTDGLTDMYYGVCAARKGMLTADMCLNTLPLEDLIKALKK